MMKPLEKFLAWLKKLLKRWDFTIALNFPFVQAQFKTVPSSRDPKLFWTEGSSYNSFIGTVSTICNAEGNNHSPAFFSKKTVLLGKEKSTTVSWKIKIEPEYIQKFSHGYLLIACIREFGGLHSKHRGSKVSISLNNYPIDECQLLEKPQGHSDFFHVNRNVKPSNLEHLSTYSTIYTWPILKDSLLNASEQTVTVSIEKSVYWDIDDVAIQCYVK